MNKKGVLLFIFRKRNVQMIKTNNDKKPSEIKNKPAGKTQQKGCNSKLRKSLRRPKNME